MADSLLGNVTGKLVGCLCDAVKDQMTYLCCYSCNVQRLADEVPELNSKKGSVEQDVDAAKNNLEVIRPEVESWLREAEVVLTKSTRVLEDAAQAQKSCLPKWCPVLNYTLSRDAKETTETSIKLRNGCSFERISNPVNPGDIDPVPAMSEIGLMSRDSLENKIMDALEDERVYLIGLQGMGGVGKTTMAKKIEKRAHEMRKGSGSMFKRVVMAVVSQKPDLPKIQQEIAEGLGLEMKQESPGIRAKLLHQRIKDENGVLIILDDVWERLNVEELGIPSQSTNAMCKLILTSRFQNALILTEDAMIFSLDVLTDEESWILFKKNAGNAVDSPDLDQIAKDVAKECKGLPLALVTVGRALRGRRKSSWEDALLQLHQSMPRNIPYVLKDVYGPLLLSFNHLESEEYRYLFLLCCLFEEDSIISCETLVRYGIGLEIFEGIENLGQARNRVETIVEYLISSSLLIETSRKSGDLYVKMHDVIRDMCIWITSEGNITSKEKHIFKISHGEKEWLKEKEDSCGNYSCISLTFSRQNIVVSGTINCPRLELLHIDCKTVLADNFFSSLRGLKILEASRLKSIPSSIQVLKNLRTLCLTECKLEKTSVAGFGELINLEILCLEDCDLKVLPKEMGELKKLRKLYIHECWPLKIIAFGVVAGLVQLEELAIIKSFRDWKAEENDDKLMNNASVVELDSLNRLTTLHIQISSPNVIPEKKPHWVKRLKRYSIDVSDRDLYEHSPFIESEYQSVIRLDEGGGTRFGDWFYDMARDAECLQLAGSNCMFVVNHLCGSGYQNLKDFRLANFTNVQYLSCAFGDDQFMGAVFPILKCLWIEDSDSLKEIIAGSPPVGSFEVLEEIRLLRLPRLVRLWAFSSENPCLSNLNIVEIEKCESMLYLFPLSLAERLSHLSKLEVSNCPLMKEIFKKEEGEMEITIKKIEFPKLECLVLENLERFNEFCKAVVEIDVPMLRDLRIRNIPSIMEEGYSNIHQQFLFDQVTAGNSLKLHMMFCPLANFNFSTGLQKLEIKSIHNFKSFFSHSTLSFFPSLRKLSISDCSMLEEVIGRDEENVTETKAKTILFPRLEYLGLSNLSNILTFCHGMSTDLELPSLRRIAINDCPMMEAFDRQISGTNKSFFNGKVFWPRLRELILEKLNIAGIFSHNSIDNFCRLQYLSIRSCHRLKNLFSPLIFKTLKNLIKLSLKDCKELQEVIVEKDEEEPIEMKIILSPELETLWFDGLPKMQTFCRMNNRLELPSLRQVGIEGDCPMLERFSLGSLHLPRFQRIYGLSDHDFVAKFFFNKEKSSHEIHSENNCFTISASDLSIDTAETRVWWYLLRNSSDGFVDAAWLEFRSLMEITGKFETIKLSAGVVYKVIFMIMLVEGYDKWEEPVDLKLTLSGQIIQHRREILYEKPRDEWIEILVGEFTREAHQIGDLEFSMYQLGQECIQRTMGKRC